MLILYYTQNDRNDSPKNPNAHETNDVTPANATLSTLLKSKWGVRLGLNDPSRYHIRVRSVDKRFGYVWKDVLDPHETLPLSADGNLILKLVNKSKLRTTSDRYPSYALYKTISSVAGTASSTPLSSTSPAPPNPSATTSVKPVKTSSSSANDNTKKRTQGDARKDTMKRGGGEEDAAEDGLTAEERAKLRVRERERQEAEELARKVADVREAEKAKEASQAARGEVWAELRGALIAWQGGSDSTRKPVRALLSSLHTVLWEGANWTPVTVLVRPNEVKLAYRKAMLLVHPDKVGSDAPHRVQVIAKFCFENLNAAYEKFEEAEMR